MGAPRPDPASALASDVAPDRERGPERGPEPFRPASVIRWDGTAAGRADDVVAAEEPLQVILDGRPFAVIMRTPGHDLELVLGLLYVEGLIHSAEDVRAAAVAASGRPARSAPFPVRELPEAENLVDLALVTPHDDERVGWQRNLVASSACGICGAAALDALRDDLPMLPAGPTFAAAAVVAMAPALRAAQATFQVTGGLHAAGLFDRAGRLEGIREDVGRHNAVDKLIGGALLDGALPLRDHALLVSGRASFELAHKAVAAGLPLMAAVSAPSSLAVHVAHTFGLTLVGFLRGDHFNVYAGGERIVA
ncbi:MAG TPA: formate dehydrogenase accessory sulfurtransferase FdhD [Candidatus Sulfotelmatobacter sp.]|nr:formate dehydrogenase accessory sulfurtransferase FdhD [Candidatus Sulfotelmatobacter sp.]